MLPVVGLRGSPVREMLLSLGVVGTWPGCVVKMFVWRVLLWYVGMTRDLCSIDATQYHEYGVNSQRHWLI